MVLSHARLPVPPQAPDTAVSYHARVACVSRVGRGRRGSKDTLNKQRLRKLKDANLPGTP
jgi:hypothetical protein